MAVCKQIPFTEDIPSDGVYVDSVNGSAGTTWPIGLPQTPVNSLTDAKTIAVARGTKNIHIYDVTNLDIPSAMDGYKFFGRDLYSDGIDVNNQSVALSYFRNLNVIGNIPVTSRVTMENCFANYDGDIYGDYFGCIFEGFFTLKTGMNSTCYDCTFDAVSVDFPGGNLYVYNAKGLLTLENMAAGTHYIFGNGLRLVIAATCAAGTINVWGDVTIIDSHTAACVVNDYTVNKKVTLTPTTDSHDITTINDLAETTVFTLTKTGAWGLSVYLDLATLVAAVEGGTITVRYYQKTDASNYAKIGESVFVVGTDTVMPSCEISKGYHGFKCTIQCSTDVTITHAVPYVYIIQE